MFPGQALLDLEGGGFVVAEGDAAAAVAAADGLEAGLEAVHLGHRHLAGDLGPAGLRAVGAGDAAAAAGQFGADAAEVIADIENSMAEKLKSTFSA